MIKKELRYIRYRICRSIYYADQCPKDCRKNYSIVGQNILGALALCAMTLVGAIIFVVLA